MNKQRIAELREKSKPTVENNNGLGLWNNGLVNDWYEQWFENFAELIVRECMETIEVEPRFIERINHNSKPVDRVYVVETMLGETEDAPMYSLQEAAEFLEDAHDTNNGRILDAKTGELVANVVNGNIELVGVEE